MSKQSCAFNLSERPLDLTDPLTQRFLCRLRRDLKEVSENPLDLVSAQPLHRKLCFWHCNLREAPDSPFEDCVFHIEIAFHREYPARPPYFQFLTPFRHQNLFGKFGCLDMLERGQWSGTQETTVPYTGWTSAYTVQSVLMQLQSFLMETQFKERDRVQEAHATCLNFHCEDCGHTGAKPWPPLPNGFFMTEREPPHEAEPLTVPSAPPHSTPEAAPQSSSATPSSSSGHTGTSSPFIPPPICTTPPVTPLIPSTRPVRATPSPSPVIPSSTSPVKNLGFPSTPVSDFTADKPSDSGSPGASTIAPPTATLLRDPLEEKMLQSAGKEFRLPKLPFTAMVLLLDFLSLGDLRNLAGVSMRLEILANDASNLRGEVLNAVRCFFSKRYTKNLTDVRSAFDLLSADAFDVMGVRLSVWKERFSHFLPVVIDTQHWARTKPRTERVISELALNIVDRPLCFDPLHVLKVLPPLMNSQVVDLMKGGTHASTKALEGYCTPHHLFLQLCHDYPTLQQVIDERAKRFARSAAARHKLETPSLGDFIACLSVTDAVTWKDVGEVLVSEALDRNVLWLVKAFPYLGDVTRPFSDLERMNRSLTVNAVSLRLLVFQVWFLHHVAHRPHLHFPHSSSRVIPGEDPRGEALECSHVSCALPSYSRAKRRPAPSLVDRLQRRVKSLLSLSSWPAFFNGVGLPIEGPQGSRPNPQRGRREIRGEGLPHPTSTVTPPSGRTSSRPSLGDFFPSALRLSP
uniref:UBC core domain-containing protein n=1 Tax=Chromera velia CCMP2878 TaxID=1169474 RepID=A0A0G4HZ39_9ALVE|eukprot:Cvel_9610.t1-p1 / transcript=Cvel_9610.t1 / gene=Cvel_9610 / organism=Chromera_velia_CCMP2878 / gene_product=Ubiquitin-conjugating enzyme E2-17 kDa, putative / transcript_product=Ubiquitin-conjugating enzyme E2-17 kDa, putative / location=Cvel_scaffold558:50533-53276(+) / protein_length=743 / sequence_SO=supercontig / SO=protein_coding / is_pseudo=false